jgi:radical SAM protein with 4Fe4S-binding SPASM domain
VLLLAEIARDIGMDYLVIKPYSHHQLSKTERYKNITYESDLELHDSLQRFNNEHFRVIFRAQTMKKWDEAHRNYKQCFALPFWSYIDAGGTVWGCSAYLGDKRFYYGNIYENGFQEIWESKERLDSLEMMKKRQNVEACRINCRMDKINRYLWELKYPPEHVNFI